MLFVAPPFFPPLPLDRPNPGSKKGLSSTSFILPSPTPFYTPDEILVIVVSRRTTVLETRLRVFSSPLHEASAEEVRPTIPHVPPGANRGLSLALCIVWATGRLLPPPLDILSSRPISGKTPFPSFTSVRSALSQGTMSFKSLVKPISYPRHMSHGEDIHCHTISEPFRMVFFSLSLSLKNFNQVVLARRQTQAPFFFARVSARFDGDSRKQKLSSPGLNSAILR